MDEFMAVIKPFAGNFAPENWMFCHGQLLEIESNHVLFSLIGTTYGGDGMNTFQLPDLRSRVAIGIGQGQGLSHIVLGQFSGQETVSLRNVAATPMSAAGNLAAASPAPHNNRQPYVGIHYIICVQGIYPQ